MNEKEEAIISDEVLLNKIYMIRGQKVMLDMDLAELYQTETRTLKQAVKRNIDIFPQNFMSELTDNESNSLRSQIVISKKGRGGSRYTPMAFTEHGILQLANVLKSKQARTISIRIIELFVKMREMILTHKDLLLETEEIRKKMVTQDERIDLVFDYLTQFITKDANEKERRKIGFKTK
jgi:hypothetical protein